MDDDDKVRRNLMVTCALVATYIWLDVPATNAINKLLGLEPAQSVSAIRVWIAIVVVLLYQGYRYFAGTFMNPRPRDQSEPPSEYEQARAYFLERFKERRERWCRRSIEDIRRDWKPSFVSRHYPSHLPLTPSTAVGTPPDESKISTWKFLGIAAIPGGSDYTFRLLVQDYPAASTVSELYVHVPPRWAWRWWLPCLLTLWKTRYFAELGVPLIFWILVMTAAVVRLWAVTAV